MIAAAYGDVGAAVAAHGAAKEQFREVRTSHDFDVSVVATDEYGASASSTTAMTAARLATGMSPSKDEVTRVRPEQAARRATGPRHPGACSRPGEELAMSLWDVMVSIFWFFVLFAWIWLLISILGDIFRDHELSGWGKAGWTLFLIVLPWVGALTYLIVRGRSMNERTRAQAERNDQAFRRYVQETAAPEPASTADELAKLADLRDRGAISTEDYELAKTQVLGQAAAPSAPQQRDPRRAAPTM